MTDFPKRLDDKVENTLVHKEGVKQKIVECCRSDRYTEFGDLQVRKIVTVDGYKYYLDKEEWGMIRPSGTEPVLRTDAESSTTGGAFKVLEKTHQAINP